MRKLIILILLLLMVTGVTVAQEATEESAEDPEIEWTCPEGFEGHTLSVYNWATYIGETTVSTFEELCDVTVNYDVYDSNESLIARLRQGNPGYDIAFPSDYAVAIMARDGLIQQIDVEAIPNFENIAERWLNQSFDPDQEYSVPYLWGTFGVAYDVNAVEDGITSWDDVFEFDGRVAWVDDSRSTIGIGLQLLGYPPNSTDEDEIAEARDFLLENSDNVVAIAGDDGQALLQRGEVDIALEYNGDVFQIIQDCECDDFAYVIPEEGSVVDLGTMVLLEDAPNPELALVFMDYIHDPVVSALIVNDAVYATPNEASVETGVIDEALLNSTAIFPSEDSLDNLFFLQDIGDAEENYNNAWEEILILGGA
jgi:spermidine/putrescine transport system substrate-binding protein